MVNDPIGDMLTRIRNAAMAQIRVVEIPYSKLKEAVGLILVQEGYLTSVEKVGVGPKTILKAVLAYSGKTPILSGVKRISKPGLRWYVGKKDIPKVLGGMGTAILSTPEGIMTGKEAQDKGTGGEVVCEVW